MNGPYLNVPWVQLLFLVLLAPLSMAIHAAQLCNNAIVHTAPDSRYQDNGDGTILDLETNLLWQQCTVGLSGNDCTIGTSSTYSWDNALQYPSTLNANGGFAGYNDWRLPNRNELASLLEYACYVPSINQNIFPNTSIYEKSWSSSPSAGDHNEAWFVDFTGGGIDIDERIDTHLVRLVRSQP